MVRQQHRAQRRRELIAAARRVVVRDGLTGANVRTVAAEAEVSAGSVLYQFESFGELMYTTVEGVFEEMYERRRELAERAGDPGARIAALIEAGIPDEISPNLRMAYESVPLLRKEPRFKPLHRSIVERQVMLYRTVIEIGAGTGAFAPASEIGTIARNLVALEDAYDLYPLIGLEHPAQSYRRHVASYAELALGCTLPEPEPPTSG